MRYTQAIFNPQNAIRYYLEEQFYLIPKEKLMDFVLGIQAEVKPHLNILESWEKYFRSLRVPYCITWEEVNGRKYLRLWKEKIAGD